MSRTNIVEVSTPFGYRCAELHQGDLSRLSFEVDVICVSAFKGDFYPTRGTLVGALLENCGIDLATLSEAPLVRGQEGVWLSPEITGQKFRHVACVEMLDLAGQGSVELALRNLFSLFLVAQMHDLELRTVAMPILGSGRQGVSPSEVLPLMMELTQKALRSAPTLERVVFMALDEELFLEIDGAMNTYLKRTDADMQPIPSGQLAELIRAELLANLGSLHPHVAGNPSATAVTTMLIERLKDPEMRFLEVASLSRRLAESLVVNLLGVPETSDLFKAIEKLGQGSVSGKSVARWVINYLHTIRVFGNVSLHETSTANKFPADVGSEDLLALLFTLSRLAEFWVSHCTDISEQKARS